MACRSAWLSGCTDPLGRSSSSKGNRCGVGLAMEASFLLVLAGGPLRAWPATLLAKSRLSGRLAGRLTLMSTLRGALLAVDPLDGHAGPLSVGPLGRVTRVGAEGPVRSVDVVAASIVLDLSSGVAPAPPASGRLGHRPQGVQDIAGALLLDGEPGGAPLPGQGPHDLPILRPEVGVGLQPAVAALLILPQLPLPVTGAVGLLGGHRQSTRHASRLVIAAAQPAKHARGRAAGGLLVAGQGYLRLLTMGRSASQLPSAVAGGPVELAAQPVPLGPQLRRGQPVSMANLWPPARDRAWASCTYPSGCSRSGRSSSPA